MTTSEPDDLARAIRDDPQKIADALESVDPELAAVIRDAGPQKPDVLADAVRAIDADGKIVERIMGRAAPDDADAVRDWAHRQRSRETGADVPVVRDEHGVPEDGDHVRDWARGQRNP